MAGVATLLDRYILRQCIGTMFAVLGIVMSLMMLENFPRLIEITRQSGHRAHIVAQSAAALLPEYLGIGLLVGLYLALAFAIRRLAMRGELDAIEAAGVGERRWMRMPLLLTLAVAVLIVANQGWLLPGGESRLADLGRRMQAGEFGLDMQPNRFVDLGDGRTLMFGDVSADRRYIEKVFLVDDGTTYAASRGRLTRAPDGQPFVELQDGQSIDRAGRRVGSFSRLLFRGRRTGSAPASEAPPPQAKVLTLPQLLTDPTPGFRAAALGRVLWGVLALIVPVLALALARPPRRSASALGLMAGLVLLVAFLKSIALVADDRGSHPELLALAMVAAWLAIAGLLRWGSMRTGAGFVDTAIMRVLKAATRAARAAARAVGRRLPGRPAPDLTSRPISRIAPLAKRVMRGPARDLHPARVSAAR